jgi:lipoprotein signal peptidase
MDSTVVTDRETADHAPEAALTHLGSHLRFWLVAGLILVVDLWSKKWIFANLGPSDVKPVLGHLFEFRRSINDGAVFGFFTGQVGLFIVASLFAFGFVFYLFVSSPRTQRGLHLALGLILAGALGNLYDRAVMKADILTYRAEAGESGKYIGRLTEDSTEEYVHIGQWPEGKPAQRFARSEVDIRQQGIVRDFIKFVPRFPAWVPRLGGRDIWPWVFNIADAALVCGVGALLCTSWLSHRTGEQR